MSSTPKIYAEIITIGDEILYGQITDTNTQWISSELDRMGIRTRRKTTVGDSEDEILAAFDEAGKRADIVFITGGLGPTRDDLTKPCLARFFNTDLYLNEDALQEVTDFFRSKGKELTELNKGQAMMPRGSVKIKNKKGTAPGIWLENESTIYIAMPGVPHEMKHMMKLHILPQIAERFHRPVIFHKMIKTIGIGESWLSEKIKNWEDALPAHIRLAYLPNFGQVRLRLTASGKDLDLLKADVSRQIDELQLLAGEYIFGYDDDEIQEVVGKLLRKHKLTLSAAESCSGGYFSHMITSVPGSSDYFLGGIVSYANDVKINELGVDQSILAQHGAVSRECIEAMASGVKEKLNTSLGVASSGIAGPGGGTEQKPVGTVWIAVAFDNQVISRKLQLGNDRLLNIRLTAIYMLDLIRKQITKYYS